MEEALLLVAGAKGEEKKCCGLGEELKKLSYIAAPMVVVSVSQQLLQVVSVMMAGHLGELSLSGVAIANSFTAVTGFSLLFGMAGGLETLCGQAYGAEQYKKLGTYTYCSIISLILVCIPVSLLWMFVEKILIFIGQDPLVCSEAGKYSIFLIPALLAYAVLQSLIRYFITQGLILPMLLSSCATLCFHVPLCWALVYKFELGTTGAALSICFSYWLTVIFLVIYIKYSPACEKTRVSFSLDVFLSIPEFFRFGLPSAVMSCLEWWSFEILILLSGLLPNSKLETSVLSICLSTTSLHYFIPYGVGAAVSTRILNELGAGNPQGARAAVIAATIIAVVEAISVSIILFCCRSVLGNAYSNEKKIVDYVAQIAPLLSLSVLMDSLQSVFSVLLPILTFTEFTFRPILFLIFSHFQIGVARGTGWQRLAAYVNLGAYYLVGLPLALVLCFMLHLRGIGLWIGILAGSTTQSLLYAFITSFTNWQKKAIEARERIFERTSVAGSYLS
ncbi:protein DETOXIFICATION 14-like [Humulus lupulus]|uniref:protein DETOXIFICATION 14-like n=1 Tax=Humulus lupulus TaxID=3486 RepID=UPI002B402D6C|nr:protein DETOXIFICATION 14-like [Humulus lupulus]